MGDEGLEAAAMRLCLAFNGDMESRARLAAAALGGDEGAANTEAWMAAQGLSLAPARPIGAEEARALHTRLLADPEGFVARGPGPYPATAADRHWGFDRGWIAERLALSRARLARMAAERQSETAVLVGNGPSLNRTDLSLLDGQEVFVSNYAVRHPRLGPLARGVAVSNHFVAAQAPHAFQTGRHWRVHPVWLGHVLGDTPTTIWLNALGGPLFFSRDVTRRVAWHATGSVFWLQVLHHLGYRRVLLIGFDHSYVQPEGAREGDLIRQETDDPNHFDPGYFRDKVWQAADVGHMEAALRLARGAFEEDEREILNCTEGGALEVFRRAPLGEALRASRSYGAPSSGA